MVVQTHTCIHYKLELKQSGMGGIESAVTPSKQVDSLCIKDWSTLSVQPGEMENVFLMDWWIGLTS